MLEASRAKAVTRTRRGTIGRSMAQALITTVILGTVRRVTCPLMEAGGRSRRGALANVKAKEERTVMVPGIIAGAWPDA